MSLKVDQDQDTDDPTIDDGEDKAASTVIDIDEAELQAAIKEVEAEEADDEGGDQVAEADGDGEDQDRPADTADQPDDNADGADGDQQSPPESVPYARFAEQNNEVRQLREQVQYLSGAVEALRAGSAQPGTPQPPQERAPSRQDIAQAKIDAAKQRVEQAAERLDKGEISTKEYSTVQLAASEEIAAVRNALVLGAAQELVQRQRPQPPQQAPEIHYSLSDQDFMDRHLEGLAAKYPEVGPKSPLTEQNVADLTAMVIKGLGGVDRLHPNPVIRTMQVREGAARLATVMVPFWYPDYRRPDQSQATAAATGQTTGNQRQLSAQAQARADKLALAENHPPDIRGVGSAGESEGLSESRIIRMTDEELENLPAALLDRFLE